MGRVGLIGIDEDQSRSRVLEDVGDVFFAQPVVDRHEDAPSPTDTEEADEELRSVGADDRHPVTLGDAPVSEAPSEALCSGQEVGVGEGAETADHS